jgi:hypothetical protein
MMVADFSGMLGPGVGLWLNISASPTLRLAGMYYVLLGLSAMAGGVGTLAAALLFVGGGLPRPTGSRGWVRGVVIGGIAVLAAVAVARGVLELAIGAWAVGWTAPVAPWWNGSLTVLGLVSGALDLIPAVAGWRYFRRLAATQGQRLLGLLTSALAAGWVAVGVVMWGLECLECADWFWGGTWGAMRGVRWMINGLAVGALAVNGTFVAVYWPLVVRMAWRGRRGGGVR